MNLGVVGSSLRRQARTVEARESPGYDTIASARRAEGPRKVVNVNLNALKVSEGMFIRKTTRCFIVAASVTLAVTAPAQQHLLRELKPSLRGTGLRVRPIWSEKARSAPPATPTLAPLRGFPARGGSGYRWQSFGDFFRVRAFEDAALIAVRGKARSRAKVAREFPRLWRRAPPTDRVFVAFSRRDGDAASAVRRALERKGYFCFTYIHGQSREPWANGVEVGRFFREAGVRLVIDSRSARASGGVRLEAHALTDSRNTRLREDSCCRICYYLNGTLAGCDPVTCGPQCVNARGAAP